MVFTHVELLYLRRVVDRRIDFLTVKHEKYMRWSERGDSLAYQDRLGCIDGELKVMYHILEKLNAEISMNSL
jgi:hypothetical protein